MPRPKGETHHSASLTRKQAQAVKTALVKGRSVARVARLTGLPYQTVYRIATGETWRELAPAGPVHDVKHETRGPRRKVGLKTQHLMWRKRRGGATVAAVSERTGVSESSVRRLVSEFELMLCHRVSQLQLTAGSYEPAKRKYGIPRTEAQQMDERAVTEPLPARLRSILDEDFPELERQLNRSE